MHCQICKGVSPESKARAYFLEVDVQRRKRSLCLQVDSVGSRKMSTERPIHLLKMWRMLVFLLSVWYKRLRRAFKSMNLVHDFA